jgi:DHA2 family multidrug resistance protein-like MFS transporter
LIDLALFRDPAISVSLAVNVFLLLAWSGNFLFIAQYLQLVLGMGAFEAGLWTIPGMLASMVGALAAPLLIRRWPVARIICGGIVFSVIGFAVTLALEKAPGPWVIALATSIMFAGIAATMTLTTDMIVSAAPHRRAGAASAISETASELGLALGIAVLGSVGAATYRASVASAIPATADAQARQAILDTLSAALNAAEKLGPDAEPVLAAARAAFVDGLQAVAMVSTVVALMLAVLVAFWLKPAAIAPAERG